MAIYRCEFKIISRGSGHRACAAAAYRAGEKIMDERYGAAHDYTRKTGVAASFILAPENAPDWMSNRTELWNAVEAVERRKDAQLCREVLLSLLRISELPDSDFAKSRTAISVIPGQFGHG